MRIWNCENCQYYGTPSDAPIDARKDCMAEEREIEEMMECGFCYEEVDEPDKENVDIDEPEDWNLLPPSEGVADGETEDQE